MLAAFFQRQVTMKAEFIQRVMQIMNELGWNDTQSGAFVGSDTTQVKEHIEAVFVDAWRKSVNVLPKTYFTVCLQTKVHHYGLSVFHFKHS